MFQKIVKMATKFSIGDCAGGHRIENRDKNRDISTVPREYGTIIIFILQMMMMMKMMFMTDDTLSQIQCFMSTQFDEIKRSMRMRRCESIDLGCHQRISQAADRLQI